MKSIASLLLLASAALAFPCDAPKPAPKPAAANLPKHNNKACRLPAQNDVYLSVGFNYQGDCVPSTGTLRGYMIFVDFSDAPAPKNDPPKNLRDVFLPDAKTWYEHASYGQLHLNVTSDVKKYYRMPKPAASYGWDNGLTYEQHEAYIQDALAAYTGNGVRPPPPETEVLYVVPTRAANAYMTRSMEFAGRVITPQGKTVSRKAVTFGVDPFYTWGYGALNHETGHTMCLPDYYPYAAGLTTQEYVGGWSLMGDIGGPGRDFFAWDKYRLGWLSDASVDCVSSRGTSDHILTPLETKGGVKAVVVAKSKTTALVLEVRTTANIDHRVCAPGVLMYTVDTGVPSGEGPVRVLDANPGTGGCGGENGELNDGTLSLTRGKSEFVVPGWGITVRLVSKVGGKYKVRVKYT